MSRNLPKESVKFYEKLLKGWEETRLCLYPGELYLESKRRCGSGCTMMNLHTYKGCKVQQCVYCQSIYAVLNNRLIIIDGRDYVKYRLSVMRERGEII